MWVTLAEALGITELELGFESFSNLDFVAGYGQLSTSGATNVLDWTGDGDLTTILASGDLVVIDLISYIVESVATNQVTILDTITLALSNWSYVKESNISTYQNGVNKRLRALQTAFRNLSHVTCEADDPVQDELKEANAMLGALYFQNSKVLPKNNLDENVISKKIGDMAYSYNLDKSKNPIPDFIISILGSCYTGGIRAFFFDK